VGHAFQSQISPLQMSDGINPPYGNNLRVCSNPVTLVWPKWKPGIPLSRSTFSCDPCSHSEHPARLSSAHFPHSSTAIGTCRRSSFRSTSLRISCSKSSLSLAKTPSAHRIADPNHFRHFEIYINHPVSTNRTEAQMLRSFLSFCLPFFRSRSSFSWRSSSSENSSKYSLAHPRDPDCAPPTELLQHHDVSFRLLEGDAAGRVSVATTYRTEISSTKSQAFPPFPA